MRGSRRHILAVGIVALGLAAGLEAIVQLEWSYPACEQMVYDGPAPAVYGFPLPNRRGGPVSGSFALSPAAYGLGLALMALPLGAGAHLVSLRLPAGLWRPALLGALAMCLLGPARYAVLLDFGWRLRSSPAPRGISIGTLRPRTVSLSPSPNLPRTCIPSAGWPK